jgi:hypothetical protein
MSGIPSLEILGVEVVIVDELGGYCGLHHELLPQATQEVLGEVALQHADILQNEGDLGVKGVDELGGTDLVDDGIVVIEILDLGCHFGGADEGLEIRYHIILFFLF